MLQQYSDKSGITTVWSKVDVDPGQSDSAPESGDRGSSRTIFILKILVKGFWTHFKINSKLLGTVLLSACLSVWPTCWRGREPRSCAAKLGPSTDISPLGSHCRISSENRIQCQCGDDPCPYFILKNWNTVHFVLQHLSIYL